MQLTRIIIFLFLAMNVHSVAQTEKNVWKALVINEQNRVWYDQTQMDTINTSKFSIWLLELHRPYMELEGVSKNIMRTKSLYSISLDDYRYSLKEVVYYNPGNVEIKRFRYDIDSYDENVKYYFPITPNSIIQNVIDELLRVRQRRDLYKQKG